MISSQCITWFAVVLTMSVAIVTVNLTYQSFFLLKKRSFPTRAKLYLVIKPTIVDMFVGGFSHSSTYTLLCDILKFPHFTLELTLTTGFLFVWFRLTSLTNNVVISFDQMHATIRPYTSPYASPH